jgi:dTDP-6-deoxy-L-talose 4-dehydrogenase (NAD+)
MATRILLTGSTGFVGRQVLKSLQEKNVEIVLINRASSDKKILNKVKISKVIYTDDIFSETIEWWSNTLRDIDLIIHLAWYLEPGEYLYSDNNYRCYEGSYNLAKGAVNSSVRRIISIGTCFEYKMSMSPLVPSSILSPETPYAKAKVNLFKTLSKFLPSRNIEFAWCRLFYLYGEFEDQRRFVPYLRSQLEKGSKAELSSGKQIRDFMDVRLAGRSIVDIALSNTVGAVNICSEKPISVREFAEQIADEYGRRDLLDFGAKPENRFEPPYIVGKR